MSATKKRACHFKCRSKCAKNDHACIKVCNKKYHLILKKPRCYNKCKKKCNSDTACLKGCHKKYVISSKGKKCRARKASGKATSTAAAAA
jgi:hypothetical protein